MKYQNILRSLIYENYKPITGETKSGRYKYTKNNLDERVNKSLSRSIQNDSDLEGQGIENIIIPSIIIDIYIRLEVLLGSKLSGHTDILTEASNLVDDLYKKGKIQNKQKNQKALNKVSTN